MNKEQKNINEIISELQFESVKREDLAFDCINDLLQNQIIPRCDIFSHEDEYAGLYQESKYYNPFSSKGIIV